MSAFLLRMRKASGYPVSWSVMVMMCWFPDLETFRSVTKSMAILLKGQSGISVMGTFSFLTFPFLHFHSCTISNVFVDILVQSC